MKAVGMIYERMKVIYRGHEIEAWREQSLGGDELLYYSVFRQSDGYECTSGFWTGEETSEQFIEHLKAQVDNELKSDDPWDEKDPILNQDYPDTRPD